MLMIYCHSFLLLIVQMNLKSIQHHPNIYFSTEKEKDGCSPFLNVDIFRENEKFTTNVYRKKTFSGVYTNFKSFIPDTCNIGLIKSLKVH